MRMFHSAIQKWLFNSIALFLLLATSVWSAFAGTDILQGSQPLFTPTASPDNLAISRDQAVTRYRYVEINFDLLEDPSTAERIVLNLYDDVVYTAVLDRLEPTQPGGYAWVGHLLEVERSQVILVVGGGQMAGNIISPLGQYQVRYAGDQVHAIYTIDQSVLPSEQAPIPVFSESDAELDLPAEAADLCTSIDVMVVWTPAARNAAGGAVAMQNLINLAVQETNQSYINSNITQRIRLAHLQEVAYAETGNFETDLTRLRDPADGYIDNVHTLRNTYYADMVSMITEGSQYCGIGYLMTSVSTSFASYAFSVVARFCATGNYTLAHELGHNQGARHDWYMDANTTPYAYAHGYVNTTDRWRTVMAYNNECSARGFYCTLLPYWSNPNLTYGGDPMGVPAGGFHPADNHQTLNNTCSTVANFRDGPDAPGAFSKTSPSDGATGVPINPTLSWGNSNGATSYEYCVDTSNDNTCGGSWVSTATATSAGLSGLLNGMPYYWQVRAKNSQGTTEANSGVWGKFTTKPPSTVYLPLTMRSANTPFNQEGINNLTRR